MGPGRGCCRWAMQGDIAARRRVRRAGKSISLLGTDRKLRKEGEARERKGMIMDSERFPRSETILILESFVLVSLRAAHAVPDRHACPSAAQMIPPLRACT